MFVTVLDNKNSTGYVYIFDPNNRVLRCVSLWGANTTTVNIKLIEIEARHDYIFAKPIEQAEAPKSQKESHQKFINDRFMKKHKWGRK
jgi:hypothetical protein